MRVNAEKQILPPWGRWPKGPEGASSTDSDTAVIPTDAAEATSVSLADSSPKGGASVRR